MPRDAYVYMWRPRNGHVTAPGVRVREEDLALAGVEVQGAFREVHGEVDDPVLE